MKRLIATEAQKIGNGRGAKVTAVPALMHSTPYFNRNEEGMTGVSGLDRISIILKSLSTTACGSHFKFGSTSSSSR
jgi:hypothetical protein